MSKSDSRHAIVPYLRVHIFGTEGRIEIEKPFNAPPDQPCRIWHQRRYEIEEIVFDVCNQYIIQGDLFSLAVLNEAEVPTSLEDAVANMRVIESVILSAESGTWVNILWVRELHELKRTNMKIL